MTFKNLFIEHERGESAEAWLEEELAEQETRFSEIEQSMKDIAPQRAKWYAEFFDRITKVSLSTLLTPPIISKPSKVPSPTVELRLSFSCFNNIVDDTL